MNANTDPQLHHLVFFPHLQIRLLSRDMRFPTMWYVRPAKPQISLLICSASEPLLVAYSMTVKLLTEQHLEFLSLKRGCTGCLRLHLSKCHIVGNQVMAHFIYPYSDINLQYFGTSHPCNLPDSHETLYYIKLQFYQCIEAAAWDFQQFDILTSVNSDEPLQLSLETPNGVQSVA